MSRHSQKICVVILSGGKGTRLWPTSRELHPKPFIRLADGESLLQKAFKRAISLPGVDEILTVTNHEFYFKTLNEYAEVTPQAPRLGFILESQGRNTGPAIAAAALVTKERQGEDTVLLVLTADHLISNLSAFEDAVEQAVNLATNGRIVTFGIKPERPDTEYGYIEAEGRNVLRFVEKPDLSTAQDYIQSGRFLWNSGMFCLSTHTALKELEEHAPQIFNTVQTALIHSKIIEERETYRIELSHAEFGRVADVSIDYALMEKTDKAAVVECEIGWSDLGSWTAIADLIEPDHSGNRVDGQAAILHDSHHCYIRGHDRLLATVGVENLIIVDTPDALLVADRHRVQEVKQVVERLRIDNHDAHRLHRTVHRPWGTYTTLEEGERFKIKRIAVNPGHSLSLQMHHHRSEHWVIVSGMASIVNGEKIIDLGPNQSTYIPAGCQHRLSNPGKIPLVLIEVQSGEYLGEDDIVRFEDVYGRN